MNNGLVNVTDALPKVSVPQISVPSISLPSVRSAIPKVTSTYSSRRIFTHPKEIRYAKDLGDILFGGPHGTLQLRNTLEKHDSIFQNVPILNKLAGLGYMTYDRFVEPLSQGKFGDVFINSLETMGGTLDILANPVKSVMPWAGGGDEGDFLRSMGWIEGEYRETYQWDTGCFIVDIIGETVSDPINWFTWGSNMIAKQGITAAKPTVKSILDTITVYRPDTNDIVKLWDVISQQPEKVQEATLRMLGEAMVGGTDEEVLKRIEKIFMDQIVDNGVDKGKLILNETAQRLYMDTLAYKQLQKKMIEATNSGLFDAYKTASRTLSAAKTFDSTLTRIATDLTPFGWGKEFVGYVFKPQLDYLHNAIMKKLKLYKVQNPNAKATEVFEVVKREGLERMRAMSSYERTGMSDILAANGLTFEDVGNMYMDMVQGSMSKLDSPRDYLSLKELFQKYLASRLDGVYIASADDDIWKYLDKNNLDVFNNHVQQLKVPILNSKYKNIKVIVPQTVYNVLYKEVYDASKEIISAQRDLIKEQLGIFHQEISKAFTKEAKRDLTFDQPMLRFYRNKLNPNIPDDVRNRIVAAFNHTIVEEVSTVNKHFSQLKNLAATILKPKAGWMGSYTDLMAFWDGLRDKDPAVTYTILGELLNHGLSEKATEEVKEAYTKYASTYFALTNYINEMDKKLYMSTYNQMGELGKSFKLHFNSLNTHDVQSPQQVLTTVYNLFNDMQSINYTKYYPMRDVLGYINGGFLDINGKKYSLGELKEFLYDLSQSNLTAERKTYFKTILEYYGINTSNARMIQELFDKRDALSMAKLQALISQAKTGHRMYNSGLDKFKNIDMRFKDMGKAKTTIGMDNRSAVREINKVMDPDKTFEEMIDKANETIKGLNEYFKNVKFTDITNKDLQFFEILVDGTGMPLHTFTELWQDVLKTDMTNLTRYEYVDLANKANAVIAMIGKIRGVAGDKRLPNSINSFLNEMLETMQRITVNTENALIEQLDLSEKIYMGMMSREAMTHVIFDTEFNQLDHQFSLFMNELKKPDSEARAFIQDLAANMENAGATEQGELLRRLILMVDNHVVYNRLAQMHVNPLYIAYDEFTQNYIDNLLHNIMASDKYRNWHPQQLANQLQKVVDEATGEAEKYIRRHLADYDLPDIFDRVIPQVDKPKIKLVVAGSRDFDNYYMLRDQINELRKKYDVTEIISGKARGADTLGEQYAKEFGIPVKEFPADWKKFGKSAGYKRNQQMVDYGDAVITFWDGASKGTKHTIDITQKAGKDLFVVNPEDASTWLRYSEQDYSDNIVDFIKKHAERHNIPIQLDTNDSIADNPVLRKKYEDTLGFTDGKTIHLNLDKIEPENVIHGYKLYNSSFRIKPDEFKDMVKTKDDAILTVYFHEASHFVNKDYLKHELEPRYSGYELVTAETTARVNQARALKDLKSKESIINAEIEKIRAVYYEEAGMYLELLKNNMDVLGLDNGKVFDVLDGSTVELLRELGDQHDLLKQVLADSKDKGIGIMSDYDFLTSILFGRAHITEKNYTLFGLRKYDKNIIKELNESFSNKSFLDSIYDAFGYIGQQNRYLAGTTGPVEELGQLHRLLTESQVKQLIDNQGVNANLYEWSVANGTIAFKTIYDPERAMDLMISPNALSYTSQEDYVMFYQNFNKQFERARNIYEHYPMERLYKVRDTLAKTYTHAGINVAPTDAMTYFMALDPTNERDKLIIMAWDGITQDITYSSKLARAYTKDLSKILYDETYYAIKYGGMEFNPMSSFDYDKMEYFRNPWRWYQAVDTAEQQLRANNIEPLLDIINENPPRYVMDELYSRFDDTLDTFYKSKDKLLHNNQFYTRYIQDNIQVRRFTTDTLNEIMDELEDYHINFDKMDDETRQWFKRAGINQGSKCNDKSVQAAFKEYIQTEEAMSIAESTAEELRAHVDMRGGFIIYVDEPYRTEPGIEHFPFTATEQEMSKQGLVMQKLGAIYKKDPDGGLTKVQDDYIYIIRRTDNINHDTPVRWKKFEDLKEPGFKKMIEAKDKILKGIGDTYIDRTGIEGIPYYYLTGETMDTEVWDAIRYTSSLQEFFGDIEQQKTYLDLTDAGAGTFYKSSYSRPQVTIVGRDAYNRFLEWAKTEDLMLANYSYKSKALNTSIQTGMVDWITRQNNKTKLLSVLFNDEFHSDNEFFHNMLDNADDKYLQEFFSRGKYTAAIVTEGKNGQPVVNKYIIRNQKTLQEARELGAHIIPENVYRNMVFTINKNGTTSKLMMLYRRTIVGLFKSIWLTSPGFLMRNFVDSEMYKNMNETGGLVNMIDMFKYEYQAGKLLDLANQVQAEVFARTNNQTFNRAVLTDVLMGLTPRERQLYYLTDTFLNSGASGSLTEAMNDFLLQFNTSNTASTEYAWERILNKAVFEGKYSPTRMIMDVNGRIEQTARFGLFLALVDKGGISVSDALARVIKTHFDYTVKSSTEDMLEQLFWFATFPMNNIMYFVNGGLERNPRLLKVFMDMNELSWNNGEYTYDQVKERSYLSYHAMAGNIRWRIGNKDYILKLGPSLFDFFNFMTNPIGEMLNRLNPIISVPLGLDEPAQLNPINAQIARAKTILSGGPILPSIYSTMEQKQYLRNKKKYYSYDYSSSSWHPKVRRGRKVYPTKYYYYIGNPKYNKSYSFGYWKRNRFSTNWFAPGNSRRPYSQPKTGQLVAIPRREYRRIKKLPIIPPELRPMTQNINTPKKYGVG